MYLRISIKTERETKSQIEVWNYNTNRNNMQENLSLYARLILQIASKLCQTFLSFSTRKKL